MTTCIAIGSVIRRVYPVEDGHWWVKQHIAAPFVLFGICESKISMWRKIIYATQDVSENILDLDSHGIANVVEQTVNHVVREFEWQRSQWGRQHQLPDWVARNEFWDQWFDWRRHDADRG